MTHDQFFKAAAQVAQAGLPINSSNLSAEEVADLHFENIELQSACLSLLMLEARIQSHYRKMAVRSLLGGLSFDAQQRLLQSFAVSIGAKFEKNDIEQLMHAPNRRCTLLNEMQLDSVLATMLKPSIPALEKAAIGKASKAKAWGELPAFRVASGF